MDTHYKDDPDLLDDDITQEPINDIDDELEAYERHLEHRCHLNCFYCMTSGSGC